MSKPKKIGRKVSFILKKDIVDRFEVYCDELGQSKTLAIERILEAHLNRYDDSKKG